MACDCDQARRAFKQLASAAGLNQGSGAHAVHLQVFRGLARAHRTGQLAAIAAGGGLGDLEAGKSFYEPAVLDAEAASFNDRLTSWQSDYAEVANQLPAALVQQIDDFIQRWRDFKDSFYFFTGARGAAILTYESEWNRYRDQVASYTGQQSAITAATVNVDGKPVRADQAPAPSSLIDRVETIAKWGALAVGVGIAVKVSSDLGVFKRIGKLAGGT